MSISAISNSNAYSSTGSSSEISQLKVEEKKLEEQLEKLEESGADSNSGNEDRGEVFGTKNFSH